MEENKVVARYIDGRLVKGITRDFKADKEFFHVYEPSRKLDGSGEAVVLEELKAVFFVKSFEGNRTHLKRREFGDEKAKGRKIICRFKDGEVMYGYTITYRPEKKGFFIFPADEKSNNERVFVVAKAVKNVKLVEDEPRKEDPAPPPPKTGGGDSGLMNPEAASAYDTLKLFFENKNEKDFKPRFEKLLGRIWYNECTKELVKRGLFGKKGTRYFCRGPVKEMGVHRDASLGYPELEAIPKHTNSNSDFAVNGKVMLYMGQAEREKIVKSIRKKHFDEGENIYVVTNGLVAWDGWNLAFYDSRENYFTVLTEKNVEIIHEIGSRGDEVSNIWAKPNPLPIATGERVIFAMAWEVQHPYHPSNPLKIFD